MNSDACAYRVSPIVQSFYVLVGYAYPESVIQCPCYLNVFKYFAGFNENAKSAYTTSRKSFGIVLLTPCSLSPSRSLLNSSLSSALIIIFNRDSRITQVKTLEALLIRLLDFKITHFWPEHQLFYTLSYNIFKQVLAA